MIVSDPEHSLAFRDRLHAAAAYHVLSPDASDLCRAILASATDAGFPGALIPSVREGNEIVVYAAAQTAAEWRRLAPALLAFAGPTLTSFDRVPVKLPEGDPVAAIVLEAAPATTTVMRVPKATNVMLGALRALNRLRDTLSRAPILQRRAPEPTSWLLAQFQDRLNVGARDSATNLLTRLRSELRLDALNLKFLEVQFLASFEDWPAILRLSGFASLCQARKPPAITAILLEALYRGHLAQCFEMGDQPGAQAAYEEHVRPLALPMLASQIAPTLTSPGWRILALEAWIAPSRRDLAEAISTHEDQIGWLRDKIADTGSDAQSPQGFRGVQRDPLDKARDALAEFDKTPSLDVVASAFAMLEKLDPAELNRLREAEPFRSLLRALKEESPAGHVPLDWPGWLERVADPAFFNALDIARRGMEEWPVENALDDPISVRRLVAALDKAQEVGVAAERTAHALPFITGWLRRDPLFPRTLATPVYANLLTLLALSASRGSRTYESSQLLVYAMLASGLDRKTYLAMIADIEELAGHGFGIEMIYWLLEVVEDLLRFGSPAADARATFLHSALAKVAPIYGRLSSLQRSAFSRLGAELGWDMALFEPSSSEHPEDSYASQLEGKRIAIYTLTETSGRQAKAAIEMLAPTAVVDCNADQVGSGKLKALSENADIFVVAWQSAKHAATDFIRAHRADRPLLYAQGRGFSSILRTIESYLCQGVD